MRTSSSTPAVTKQRTMTPIPHIYPILFNTYVHPPIYTSYIPLHYDEASSLIPMAHLPPYPQEETHHRILVPLHAQIPYGYAHVPGTMSSNPINNNSKKKKLVNNQPNISPNNKDEVKKYENLDEVSSDITTDIINQKPSNFDQSQPIKPHIEETIETEQDKDEESEKQNPTRGGKLLDNIDHLPKSTTTEPNHTSESQEIQHLPTTDNTELNTETPLNNIHVTETYNLISSPLPRIKFKSSELEIPNNIDVRISSTTDTNIPDKLNTSTQLDSQPSTTTKSSTEQSKNTFSLDPTSKKNDTKVISITVKESRASGTKNFQVPHVRLTTASIFETPSKTEEKSEGLIQTTQNGEILNTLTTSPRSANIQISTPLCNGINCQPSKTPFVTTSTPETILNVNTFDSSVQSKIVSSTIQSPRANNENDDRLAPVNLTTLSSPTSTTMLETTTLPYKTSTDIITSSSQFLKQLTSRESLNLKVSTKNTSYTQSTASYFTTLQSLYNENTSVVTLDSTENKIKPPVPVTNPNNIFSKNSIQSTSIPRHYDEPTMKYSTTTMILPKRNITFEPLTTHSSLPMTTNETITSTKSNSSQIKNTTEKTLFKFQETKFNGNMQIPAEIKTVISTTIKPLTLTTPNVQSVFPTPYNSAPQKSAVDQNQNVPETEPPQTDEDSKLWYNQINKPPKTQLNDEEIDIILKKLMKLLKINTNKEPTTRESVVKLIAPKLGDREKLIYVIFPMIRDATQIAE